MNLLDPDVIFADESDAVSEPSHYMCSDPNRCNLGSSCDGNHSYSNWRLLEEVHDRAEALRYLREIGFEVDQPPKVVIRGGLTSVITGGPTSVITGGPNSVITGGPSSVISGGPTSVITGGSASINPGGVDLAVVKTSDPTEADDNSDCEEIAPDSEDGESLS